MSRYLPQRNSHAKAHPDLEILSAYLDRQLSAEEQATLEMRLQAEPALQTELDELRSTVMLLHDLEPLVPPRSFTLDPALVLPGRPWWAGWLLQSGGVVAAFMVVLALAALYAGMQQTEEQTASSSLPASPALSEPTGDSSAAEIAAAPTPRPIMPQTMPAEAMPPSSSDTASRAMGGASESDPEPEYEEEAEAEDEEAEMLVLEGTAEDTAEAPSEPMPMEIPSSPPPQPVLPRGTPAPFSSPSSPMAGRPESGDAVPPAPASPIAFSGTTTSPANLSLTPFPPTGKQTGWVSLLLLGLVGLMSLALGAWVALRRTAR
jgi:hypothetical protein